MNLPGAIEVSHEPWDGTDGVTLRAAQRLELDTRYGADTEPGIKPSGQDMAVFLVARSTDTGKALACGGLRQLGDDTAEVKRMYVDPSVRGSGVSVLVLRALEREAKDRGWTRLRLETGPAQPDAVRFYVREGYVRIPNFGYYATSEGSLCFERLL